MAVEAVPEESIRTITMVAPAAPLDPNVAALASTVGMVAASVEVLAARFGGGKSGSNALAIVGVALGIIAIALNVAHLTMGDRAMDGRLDRIEIVLTMMAKKINPDMVGFIRK